MGQRFRKVVRSEEGWPRVAFLTVPAPAVLAARVLGTGTKPTLEAYGGKPLFYAPLRALVGKVLKSWRAAGPHPLNRRIGWLHNKER